MLLEHHADPNIKDVRGATPLHRAAAMNNLNCAKLMFKHTKPVDVNCQDVDGNTPMYKEIIILLLSHTNLTLLVLYYRHLACEDNYGEMAQFLLEQGARLDVLNKEERSPLDVAPRGLATILTRKLEKSDN